MYFFVCCCCCVYTCVAALERVVCISSLCIFSTSLPLVNKLCTCVLYSPSIAMARQQHARLLRVGQRCFASDSSKAQPLSPAFVIWGSNTDVGKTLLGASIAQSAVQAQVNVLVCVLEMCCCLCVSCCVGYIQHDHANLHPFDTQMPLLYLKPLQTGFPTDCDGRLVVGNHPSWCTSLVVPLCNPCVCTLVHITNNPCSSANYTPLTQGRVTQQGNTYGPHAASLLPPNHTLDTTAPIKTLFAWQRAVSPHLAVEQEGLVFVCEHEPIHTHTYAHTPKNTQVDV